jgi:hypothetical protein
MKTIGCSWSHAAPLRACWCSMETSGKELADLPADSGADDLFYDSDLHRAYLIAGSGAVDVYEIDAGKAVRSIGVTHTSAGAKTGLFVPGQHALYVGAPASSGKPASVLVFSTK